jgi:hypothetical protein
MHTYRCTCGNRLFFENTQCVVCHLDVGWCESCHRMTSLEPLGDVANPAGSHDYRCSHADCDARIRKCHNYAVENICNRMFVPAEDDAADALCTSCRLTETIPDLNVPGNREKWARLEAAKRRLLYTLDRLGLPYNDAKLPLSFDFKADVEPPANEWRDGGPTEIVYTGHADGKITINLREADDAVREKLRVEFHEAHRTLIGHFHHEIGHYYWQLLVEGSKRCKRDFIAHFGDHDSPPYADAMAAYYQNGPAEDWPGKFISAYASAHPWEDFAETFALYLDMAAVLDTASHLFKSIKANFRSRSVKPLVERFQEIGILENEFNRTMGLIDLVPEVIVTPVVVKLQFIHDLVRSAGKPRRTIAGKAAGASQPIPMLMQQGSRAYRVGAYFDPPMFEPAIVAGGLP